MKTPFVTAMACILLSQLTQAANSLSDDFNGTQINTGIWQVQLPYANSSVTEAGGNVTFKSRGQLITTSPFAGSPGGGLDIRGSFAFTGGDSDDCFRVALRTDGAVINVWGEVGGPEIVFNGPANGGGGNAGITDETAYGDNGYTFAYLPFALNTYYNFRITDDGSNIALYVSDLNNPLVTVQDTYSLGNRIGLDDRETYADYNQNPGVSLDYISIAVPEPSTFALLGSGIVIATVTKKQRR